MNVYTTKKKSTHHLAFVFPIGYCQATHRFYPSFPGSSRLKKASTFGSSTLSTHSNVLFGAQQINTQVEVSVQSEVWGLVTTLYQKAVISWLQCSWVTLLPLTVPIWSLPEGQRWHSRWPLCYSGPQYLAGKWYHHMHGTIWLAYPSLQSAAL